MPEQCIIPLAGNKVRLLPSDPDKIITRCCDSDIIITAWEDLVDGEVYDAIVKCRPKWCWLAKGWGLNDPEQPPNSCRLCSSDPFFADPFQDYSGLTDCDEVFHVLDIDEAGVWWMQSCSDGPVSPSVLVELHASENLGNPNEDLNIEGVEIAYHVLSPAGSPIRAGRHFPIPVPLTTLLGVHCNIAADQILEHDPGNWARICRSTAEGGVIVDLW